MLEVCSGFTGQTDADKMVLSNCNTPLPTSILHRLRKSCVPVYLLGKEFLHLASTGYVSVWNPVHSPTFSQHLPLAPHSGILWGSSTGMCGTDNQSERWSPLLQGPSPRSGCLVAGLCSVSSHKVAQEQQFYILCQCQHSQGAWLQVRHRTAWTANL